ncbi:hypothetical protein RV14_GL001878 [Enterococcus ratti]|uniref:Uncharacterized protein n=1 Tax=Enterococcus ratti TaxID=150033 RepID=A0A1L8WQA2_9ENTE|nr:hypothetical protein RV14_GL001878 [Enterococcus ratti]
MCTLSNKKTVYLFNQFLNKFPFFPSYFLAKRLVNVLLKVDKKRNFYYLKYKTAHRFKQKQHGTKVKNTFTSRFKYSKW